MNRSSNFTKDFGELICVLSFFYWGTSFSFICICVFVFLSLASLTLTLSQFIGPQLAKRASERTERVVNTDDSRTNPSFSSFLLTHPLPCKVKNIKTKRQAFDMVVVFNIQLCWKVVRREFFSAIFAHLSEKYLLNYLTNICSLIWKYLPTYLINIWSLI